MNIRTVLSKALKRKPTKDEISLVTMCYEGKSSREIAILRNKYPNQIDYQAKKIFEALSRYLGVDVTKRSIKQVFVDMHIRPECTEEDFMKLAKSSGSEIVIFYDGSVSQSIFDFVAQMNKEGVQITLRLMD